MSSSPQALPLCGKVLVVGGYRGGFCQEKQLPLCVMEPVPADPRTDLPLATAKPVSNSGCASVLAYLRMR